MIFPAKISGNPLLGRIIIKYMQEATIQQSQTLYRICHLLTNVMLQPIHIVRLDERTLNLFILAGQGEEIEVEIQPDGSIEP